MSTARLPTTPTAVAEACFPDASATVRIPALVRSVESSPSAMAAAPMPAEVAWALVPFAADTLPKVLVHPPPLPRPKNDAHAALADGASSPIRPALAAAAAHAAATDFRTIMVRISLLWSMDDR